MRSGFSSKKDACVGYAGFFTTIITVLRLVCKEPKSERSLGEFFTVFKPEYIDTPVKWENRHPIQRLMFNLLKDGQVVGPPLCREALAELAGKCNKAAFSEFMEWRWKDFIDSARPGYFDDPYTIVLSSAEISDR